MRNESFQPLVVSAKSRLLVMCAYVPHRLKSGPRSLSYFLKDNVDFRNELRLALHMFSFHAFAEAAFMRRSHKLNLGYSDVILVVLPTAFGTCFSTPIRQCLLKYAYWIDGS